MSLFPVPMTVVRVRGLETYAHHGVPDEEQAIGHRYRFDLDLGLATCGATESDAVSETVNYAEVCGAVLEVCHASRRRTLERLATLVLDEMFARFPSVVWAEVTVVKPHPPAPFIVESLGVTIRRDR